ncbi:MAG: thioredoxin domain-containing protein, partial [Lentisphaerae bacterium]|nr:thioredoxin domain-containing protein [Lentisphaerota bacterium]
AEVWSQDRGRIVAAADSALARLRAAAGVRGGGGAALSRTVLDRAYSQVASSYDERYGGFGGAPKFPRPATPDFLLRHHAASGRPEALEMVLHTLRAMAAGGIHDPIGGGFHRYAVDERWHVPHFEKMLYDQAQLACTYLDAYQITHDAPYAEVVRDILDYVRRDLTGAEGQFLSAEDADSALPGQPEAHAEGAFYVWTWRELAECLGDGAAEVVGFRFGAAPGGNVREDPQGEFQGRNVLFVAHSLDETAARFNRPVEDIRGLLAAARDALRAQRGKRPRPHLDDKAITAWNGLMISAYARAFQVLGDEAYLSAARAAAGAVRERLYDEQRGVLRRCYRGSEAAIDGYLDDYAFLIRGLLDLYEASFDAACLTWAIGLQSRQDELFRDPADGGYFSTTGADPSVLLRMKNAYDGAEPSPNSIAVMNLLRLGLMTDDPRYRDRAEQTLSAFAETLSRAPHAMPQMAAAVEWLLSRPRRVLIAGDPDQDDTRRLLRVVHERFLPNKVVLLADGGEHQAALSGHIPAMASAERLDGHATAYVCDDRGCSLPTTAPDRLAALLETVPGGDEAMR